MKSDVRVEDHGSLFLLCLNTDKARNWVSDNVQEGAQFFAGKLVVEPRYVEDVLAGMALDELTIH